MFSWQCYRYQITENIGDPKIFYETISKAMTGYGRSIADKNKINTYT